MSAERLLVVGVLFLALFIGAAFSEDTWVDKVERRVKENLGDSIRWISGPDHHKNDIEKANHSSFVKKMGIGIAVAFGCLAGALACLCAYICRRKRRTAQTTQPLVGSSSLAPAGSGSSIQVGPGCPYPQGPQPYNQPCSQAAYGHHQPQQPYPPSYNQPYPQQHPNMSQHLGATAPPSAPTAPPGSFEHMPMPPPPYDYKDMSRY
ncbi:unnamed protein product [Ixodes hexagonus]